MKVWFLILVLSTGNGSEQSVVIEMKNERECNRMLNRYVYTEEEFQGPGDTIQPRNVIEKWCEVTDA